MEVEMQDGTSVQNTIQATSVLHQSSELLVPDKSTGFLWRLPVTPFGGKKSKKIVEGSMSSDLRMYHKRCATISKRWETKQDFKWIPVELRATTPYSFSILISLAHLALDFRGERELAHARLQQAHTERYHQAQPQESPWVKTKPQGSPYCEKEIHERADGLMLIDVEIVKFHRRREMQETRKQLENGRLERSIAKPADVQARAAERALSRRRAKMCKQVDLQQQLWGRFTARNSDVELVGVELAGGDVHMGGFPAGRQEPARPPRRSMRLLNSSGLSTHIEPETSTSHHHTSSSHNDNRPNGSPQALQKASTATDSGAEEEVDVLSTFALQNPDSLEPRLRKGGNRKVYSQMKHLLHEMNVSAAAPKRKKKKDMDAEAQKRRIEKLRMRAAQNSVRLPSERLDFSGLGGLDGGADKEAMHSVTNALGGLGVEREQ